MSQPDLSLTQATNAIARSIKNQPETPVVVHWQAAEFPLRVAKKLLETGHAVVWAVPSMARGDLAESRFACAGIAVDRRLGRNEVVTKATGIATPYLPAGAEPFEPPKIDRKADEARKATLKGIARTRVWAKQIQTNDQLTAPESGVITVISLALLNDPKKAAAIASWPNVVVVVDHPSHTNVLRQNVAKRKNAAHSPDDDFATRLRTRRDDQFQPNTLLVRNLRHVYLARDEWVCILLRSYLHTQGVAPVNLTTQFAPSSKLRVTVIASKLALSRYDGPAMLAISAAVPNVEVVGHAVVGGYTPESLSMTGQQPLRHAVLRVSYPNDDLFRVMERQGSASAEPYDVIRTRDHVRSAMLAFDSAARKPELVVLADAKLANIAAAFAGASSITLGGWPIGKAAQRTALSAAPTPFVKSVVEVLTQLPRPLLDGRRNAKIVQLLRDEAASKREQLPSRLARIALGLHSLSGASAPDFAGREELNIGLSDTGDRALKLFNELLDILLPWPTALVLSQHPSKTPAEASEEAERNLAARKEAFELYRDWAGSKD